MASRRVPLATWWHLCHLRDTAKDRVGEILPYLWLWSPRCRDAIALRDLVELGVVAEVERKAERSKSGHPVERVSVRLVSYKRVLELIEAAEHTPTSIKLRLPA